ncbi:hypothetical protein CAOG_01657 [Capsaspora owczarzaki ATCC 30864]|uniref:Uncharacterized protein n=1 Tax=Capsaspora owczarzaki (strain ATCC 30864) TaxID=595528 RepID=A0A0D2WJN9_CAPO3|nr:hypothetical protein CAOG_01657 [Capsaspora owczarzaki ATCC 30864]KJE90330.1 hypothetical protein CAOG_001657 [Capsaspora owczarzaki ATCC 30864]|eukprot:XP_004364525.1 hypothetical protein CAOG_01657 [Capsaspora owczarzaki ATCC 30864]
MERHATGLRFMDAVLDKYCSDPLMYIPSGDMMLFRVARTDTQPSNGKNKNKNKGRVSQDDQDMEQEDAAAFTLVQDSRSTQTPHATSTTAAAAKEEDHDGHARTIQPETVAAGARVAAQVIANQTVNDDAQTPTTAIKGDAFRRAMLGRLGIVSVANTALQCTGYSLDAYRELDGLFPKVTELDLSGAQLTSFGDVLAICRWLPALQTLSLAHNPKLQRLHSMEHLHSLMGPDHERWFGSAPPVHALSSEPTPPRGIHHTDRAPAIRDLFLGGVKTDWTTLAVLLSLPLFRHVKSLSLSHDAIADWTASLTEVEHDLLSQSALGLSVESLDLSNGTLSDLASLARAVGWMPQLTRLNLRNNRLADATSQECNSTSGVNNTSSSSNSSLYSSLEQGQANGDSEPKLFPKVRQVVLAQNSIASWAGLDAVLSVFPALAELRVAENPIYQLPELFRIHSEATLEATLDWADGTASASRVVPAQEESRMLVIARYPALVQLNGSDISSAERHDAETAWLSHYRQSRSLFTQAGSCDPLHIHMACAERLLQARGQSLRYDELADCD